ncbi:MAG: replicative DNA helicase [Bacteroidales bacterium]|nr:replicative DNA helicase [Bacteroidales bacterium]
MELLSQNKPRDKKRLAYDAAFDINGKTPPQATDLEASVLGALMLDQNALNNNIETIRTEYFYKPEHQIIYSTIQKLFGLSQPVDLLTVVEQLRKDGQLEAAGGAYYISQLTNRVVSAAHVEYHARVLAEKYIQRELIRVSTETLRDSYDETSDVVELLDTTETRLLEISDKNFRSEYHYMSDLLSDANNLIQEMQNNDGKLNGIPSGFMELDQLTSGFQPGTLVIIAARPAMGKTAFALSIARNIALNEKKAVAFFSLEMTGLELVMRLISSEAMIEGGKFKRGEKLTQQQVAVLTEKIQVLSSAPIYIDDSPMLSIFELRAKCRRLKKAHDIQAVFIDYLQLMHGDASGNRGGNREQEISNISRQLKALSKELQIPVIALSQLSRQVEQRGGDRKPQLSDLRESGAIEQDADIVAFIYRPDYYGLTEPDNLGETVGMADIILAKHRSGGQGTARLRFVKEFTRFENRVQYSGGLSAQIPPNAEFDQANGRILIDSKANFDIDDNDDFGHASDYPPPTDDIPDF